MEPDNLQYLQVLQQIEHGGVHYRQQAGDFRGFEMRGSPCMSYFLCWLCNLFCFGGRCCFFC